MMHRGQGQESTFSSLVTPAKVGAVNGLKQGSEVEALVWDGAHGHRNRLVEVVGLPSVESISWYAEWAREPRFPC